MYSLNMSLYMYLLIFTDTTAIELSISDSMLDGIAVDGSSRVVLTFKILLQVLCVGFLKGRCQGVTTESFYKLLHHQ